MAVLDDHPVAFLHPSLNSRQNHLYRSSSCISLLLSPSRSHDQDLRLGSVSQNQTNIAILPYPLFSPSYENVIKVIATIMTMATPPAPWPWSDRGSQGFLPPPVPQKISYIANQISQIKYCKTNIAYQISQIKYRKSDIAYQILQIKYCISDIASQISWDSKQKISSYS